MKRQINHICNTNPLFEYLRISSIFYQSQRIQIVKFWEDELSSREMEKVYKGVNAIAKQKKIQFYKTTVWTC